jgi:GNAT superfamily N-acetyltransferase
VAEASHRAPDASSSGPWLTSGHEAHHSDATESDADAVAQLLADMGYPTSAEAAAAHIARFAGDSGSRLQIAEDNAEGVVGLVATHIVPRLDDDGFSCRITDIVVSAAHRRSGIGSTLMTAAEQEARRAGAPRIDLSSGEWRADTRAFYTSHGFETCARALTKRLSPQP